MQGFMTTPDKAREDNPLDYLVHIAKLAKPLYQQFGLEPNVYYIPPVHVPIQFLTQMFGFGVPEAIATYRKAKDDEKLLGALLLFGSTPRIIHRFRVEGGIAYGYDEQGDEVSRVPLKEPIHIRAAYDDRFETFRSNIT